MYSRYNYSGTSLLRQPSRLTLGLNNRCEVVTLKQSDYIRQCTVATVAISIDQQWGEGPQYAGVEELQDAPGGVVGGAVWRA